MSTAMKQSQDKLLKEWQKLQHHWLATSEQWRDLLRHRFEHEFMQEYEPTIMLTLGKMQQLEHLIAQARRELENP